MKKTSNCEKKILANFSQNKQWTKWILIDSE
ncbi:hypothetical protein T4D_6823 [Trichinella pseudospiralis]|uniref:Uncharacterized protein n=1 Tax=Trichinella pseudospiralis TaxID=6337 RepID=A0A0V1DJF6_TRIPS|nr:hypothetical protein T4D_6823 [Trichinella pseudospiralis]